MVDGWTKDLADLKITDTENYKSKTLSYTHEQSDRLSKLFSRQNGANLVDTGLRLLGYGEKKLNETWPIFLEKVRSGEYDLVGHDELAEGDGFHMYSARYDPPAQEAILEAIDSGKPYRDNDFVKDLSSLDWPDYSDIVILSRRDLCYAFVHPIISAGFSKFDSVKSPGQRKKIDKIYSHASRGLC